MVADVKLTDGPFFIYRESAKRYIAIKFGVIDRDLGSAVEEAQRAINKRVELPRGYVRPLLSVSILKLNWPNLQII